MQREDVLWYDTQEAQTELQYISLLVNVSLEAHVVLPFGLLNKLANKHSVGKCALAW